MKIETKMGMTKRKLFGDPWEGRNGQTPCQQGIFRKKEKGGTDDYLELIKCPRIVII